MSDDRTALAALFEASQPGVPHTLRHYLYFRSDEAARAAAAELDRRGFVTELRAGAYEEDDYLLLAQHEMIPSEEAIAGTRQVLEGVANSVGGEYDGWEAEVRRN